MSDTLSDEELLKATLVAVAGPGLTQLPLNAVEGFLLSRVDGLTNVDMLGTLCGMPPEQVLKAVRRLLALDAVHIKGRPRVQSSAPRAAPTTPSQAPPPALVTERPREAVDLSDESQERIFAAYKKLAQSDYYTLLQIAVGATDDQIRAGYFEFSKAFHPDRYYGKRLGSYKAMLDTLFRMGKTAYETLSDQTQRARYDRSLPKERLQPASAGADPALEAHRQRILDERRKKLGQPFADKVGKAKEFAAEAEEMLRRGDIVGAAARYGVASTFDPHNPDYKRKHEGLLPQANEIRVKKVLAQAEIQANTGDHLLAARSYREAAEIVTDKALYAARAADEFMQAGELGEALVWSEHAMARAPKNPAYQLLKAQVLEKSGERAAAKTLAATVASQFPDNVEAQSFLKKLGNR